MMNDFTCVRLARQMTWSMSLPISLTRICQNHAIKLRYSDMLGIAACYLDIHGERMIIVNDNERRGRQRFSLAHEFGHFVLGHGPLAFNMIGQSRRPPYQETQANSFAAELLMPKPHLQRYGCLQPREIAEMCDVSLEAAKIRAKEMGWL